MMTTSETINSVTIIHIQGRIDATTTHDFEKYVFKELEKTKGDAILDFKDVEYISSAGLRSLLLIAKKMSLSKQNIGLCQLNENISNVIRITGFISLFKIFTDLKSALEQLSKN